MLYGWKDAPEWHQIARIWEHELGLAGVSAYGVVATVDVIADTAAELVGILDHPGAWLTRSDLNGITSIEWSEMQQLQEAAGFPGPAAQELIRQIATIGDDRELLCAIMIAVTTIGYRLRDDDPLHIIGEIAMARLLAAGVEWTQQGKRPTFLLNYRLPYNIYQYAHVIAAIAREHADILRHLRPLRFRPFVRTIEGLRQPFPEELRGGLINELSKLAGVAIAPVMDWANPAALDEKGQPIPQRDCSAEGRAAQIVVRNAIMSTMVLTGRDPDAYLETASTIFAPPFDAMVLGDDDNGYSVKVYKKPPLFERPQNEPAAEIIVGHAGSISKADQERFGQCSSSPTGLSISMQSRRYGSINGSKSTSAIFG